MDWEIVVTLSVVGMVVVGLAGARVAPDLVLSGGLGLLLITGVLDPKSALQGFGNEGLITVGVLYIVAEGVRQTGGVLFIGQRLLGQPKSLRSAQTRIMLPISFMSAFLNNTPVVVMMVPIIGDWAKKARISVSHLFLPLSYAAILGGMCTLIGTSTTLIVNGMLIEHPHGRALGMFEIAWVGVPSLILGLAFLIVFTRRLLPERKPAFTQFDDPREYTVEMIVEPGSPMVGKSIEEAGLRHLPGMYLMEIDRYGHVLAAVSSDELLQANDRLVFVGVVESVVDLQRTPGLSPATDQVFKLDSPRSERCLVEAVVSNSCPMIRRTIREARFRSRYGAAVIAVARNGQKIHKKIGDIELLPGDTLLLEAHPSFVRIHRNSRDFFLVSQVEDSAPPNYERAWVSRLIMVAMVISVAAEFTTMLKAAMVAAGLMVATRCCRWADAKRAIDWSVLLVIGAGLGIGEAMRASGAAEYLAQMLVGSAGTSPRLALAVLYFITMLFTNLITAKAAALLVFPIAMSTAVALGVDTMPFAIAVTVAAAASFATPIGYQTNLIVYGPGGYLPSDYLRVGAPISLIIWILTMLIAPWAWPF